MPVRRCGREGGAGLAALPREQAAPTGRRGSPPLAAARPVLPSRARRRSRGHATLLSPQALYHLKHASCRVCGGPAPVRPAGGERAGGAGYRVITGPRDRLLPPPPASSMGCTCHCGPATWPSPAPHLRSSLQPTGRSDLAVFAEQGASLLGGWGASRGQAGGRPGRAARLQRPGPAPRAACLARSGACTRGPPASAAPPPRRAQAAEEAQEDGQLRVDALQGPPAHDHPQGLRNRPLRGCHQACAQRQKGLHVLQKRVLPEDPARPPRLTARPHDSSPAGACAPRARAALRRRPAAPLPPAWKRGPHRGAPTRREQILPTACPPVVLPACPPCQPCLVSPPPCRPSFRALTA